MLIVLSPEVVGARSISLIQSRDEIYPGAINHLFRPPEDMLGSLPDLLGILGCHVACELFQRSRAHNLQNAHRESEDLLDPPPQLNRHQRIEPDLRQRPVNLNLFIRFEHQVVDLLAHLDGDEIHALPAQEALIPHLAHPF